MPWSVTEVKYEIRALYRLSGTFLDSPQAQHCAIDPNLLGDGRRHTDFCVNVTVANLAAAVVFENAKSCASVG